MIARRLSGRRVPAALQAIDRPQAIGLSVILAVAAAVGWFVAPLGLSVVVAIELGLGGLGAVLLIGPARPGLGIARYATLAMAGVAATLAGRMLPGGVSLLFVPLLAVLLWVVPWIELRGSLEPSERWVLDLTLTAIVFAASAGLDGVFGTTVWPPPLALLAIMTFVLALRAAEARQTGGVHGVGQALIHVLAVAQVGAAVALLGLPGLVGPAVIALAFYVWAGAAEALETGSSARSVAIEFGTLAVLGLVVAMLMHQG